MTTDIAWLKSFGLPLVMKGVQTAEDAALLAAAGVDAIYLSNHGGRQLEGAPTALETLVEIRARERWVFGKCEVWVDGGVRRGTDVLKALALGATGVGLGRPCEWRQTSGIHSTQVAHSALFRWQLCTRSCSARPAPSGRSRS